MARDYKGDGSVGMQGQVKRKKGLEWVRLCEKGVQFIERARESTWRREGKYGCCARGMGCS